MAINSIINRKTFQSLLSGAALLSVLLFTILWGRLAIGSAPLNLSGSVGYNYRSSDQVDRDKVVSSQLDGTIKASSYLWQPWFATVGGRLSVTLDSKEFDYSVGQQSKDAKIITGEFNLNVLPRSKVPFSLIFHASDSRVDTRSDNNLLTDSGQDYQTTRLDLRQSWLTAGNHRFQGRFSKGQWTSDRNRFDDQNVGLEARLRFPNQTLTTTLNSQTTSFLQTKERNTENRLLDVDHFWRPTESLTIDSMFSLSNVDTSLQQPTLIDPDESTVNTMQMSSFALWRSKSRLLTVSGGVRVADIDTEITDNAGGVFSTSARGGANYQFTKNFRGDISVSLGANDDGLSQGDFNSLRVGGLYQSDLYDLFSNAAYQWFASGSMQRNEESNVDENYGVDENRLVGRVGHNLKKSWIAPMSSNLNLNLSQTLNQNQQFGDQDDAITQVDHSVSLGWNKSATWMTAYARLFAEDRRDIDDQGNAQQLFNFQLSGMLPLNRRSEFNAAMTTQYTYYDKYYGDFENIATTSGQIGYYHQRIFGVTNLGFRSDLNISKVSLSNGVDRSEWDNRLDYSIGLLDCSLSYRIIDREGDRSNLMLVRLARRF
ncbi:MAG: hypothetical protein L3J70_08455 [Gammaproteobacteria bacterium]|nr:hypothetical protein [Gammaproteobacteria bacterium]